MSPRNPTPRRPDGKAAWFTPEHNAWLERLLRFHHGAVLELYQEHLQTAAERVLGYNGEIPPPAYDEVVPARRPHTPRRPSTPRATRAIRARPGHGPGNTDGLQRRGAVRIPEGRRVRGQSDAINAAAVSAIAGRAGAGAGAPARRPAPAPAGKRVQRGRVGNVRDNESVSSRTRSRSVRRRPSGESARRRSLEEFAYVSQML